MFQKQSDKKTHAIPMPIIKEEDHLPIRKWFWIKVSTNMYICKLSVLTRRKKSLRYKKMTLGRTSILPFKEVKYMIPKKAKVFATTFSSIKESALRTNPVSKMIWRQTPIATSSMTVPHSQIIKVQNHILIVIHTSHLKKLHMPTSSQERVASKARKEISGVSKKQKLPKISKF